MTNKPYDVGYGKPPVHSQFKSGQSGNTSGRRNGSKNFLTDLSEELCETLEIIEGGQKRRVTKQRALLKSLISRALKGDTKAATIILSKIAPAQEQREYDRSEEVSQAVSTAMDMMKKFREREAAERSVIEDEIRGNHIAR